MFIAARTRPYIGLCYNTVCADLEGIGEWDPELLSPPPGNLNCISCLVTPPPPETKIIPRNAPVPNISESDYDVSTTLYTAFKMVELRSDYANER